MSGSTSNTNGEEQRYVIISDDEDETVRYTKEEPGPSNSNKNCVARQPRDSVARQPTTDTQLPSTSPDADGDSDITITDEVIAPTAADDDEPIITNVIISREESRTENSPDPVTWQLSAGTRQYTRRVRASARRPLNRARYGPDFLSFVRELTSEGVTISPRNSDGRRTFGGSIRRSRPIRSHMHDQASFRMYSGMSRSNNNSSEFYENVAEETTPEQEHSLLRGLNVANRHLTTVSSPNRHAVLAQTAHQEMLHMHHLRERITMLRRDLQSLNGLLTNSFQLLHRVVPARNPLPCLEKEVLDRVPTRLVSESDVNNPDRACSICLAQYKMGEVLRVLPCSHQFHEYCIDRWLTSCSRNCPFCRADVQEALCSVT